MARETFISYKYSEAKDLRDTIIEKLGEDAKYYSGETESSPNLSSEKVEKIKEALKDMLYGTSVTIVIISPNMIQSEWIEWELEYSLKEIKRGDRTSRTNGIVGVIMKVNDNYDWIVSYQENKDNCKPRILNNYYLFDIIKNNRFNRNTDDKYACSVCKTYDKLSGSYISLIEEDLFLKDPTIYIENAYDKSKNIGDYSIFKKA